MLFAMCPPGLVKSMTNAVRKVRIFVKTALIIHLKIIKFNYPIVIYHFVPQIAIAHSFSAHKKRSRPRRLHKGLTFADRYDKL